MTTSSASRDAGAGLLRSILESPENDTPRLVYADWLDEHGEPDRAEFIRAQCELAVPPKCGMSDHGVPQKWCPECVHREALRRREQELLAAGSGNRGLTNCGWWAFSAFGPEVYRVFADTPTYQRGFVEGISLPTADFLQHAEALFGAQPILAVTLTDREPTEWANGTAWMPVYNTELPDQVPWKIGEHLETAGCKPHFDNSLLFYLADSPDAANAALSAACVLHGRSLAKLPPVDLPAATLAK